MLFFHFNSCRGISLVSVLFDILLITSAVVPLVIVIIYHSLASVHYGTYPESPSSPCMCPLLQMCPNLL